MQETQCFYACHIHSGKAYDISSAIKHVADDYFISQRCAHSNCRSVKFKLHFFLGRGLLQFRIEPCDNVDIHSYGKNVEEITEQLAEIWRDSDITIPVPTAHHGLFLLLHHLSELHYTDEQTGRQTDTVTCTHSLYSQIINLETPNKIPISSSPLSSTPPSQIHLTIFDTSMFMCVCMYSM